MPVEQKKSDWVTPVAVIGGGIALCVGGYLMFKKKPEPGVFTFQQPIVTPSTAQTGDEVTIQCGIAMVGGEESKLTVIVQVQEGSILAGAGDLIEQKSFSAKMIPGETTTVEFIHKTKGAVGRKDISILINQEGARLDQHHFDDAFYTTGDGGGGEESTFTLTRPTVTPGNPTAGQTVQIKVPIKSNFPSTVSAMAVIRIYEGSALSGSGSLLASKPVNFTIGPGQTYNAQVNYVAIAGSIDRRDIGVEVYVNNESISDGQWDDVFFVGGSGGGGVEVTLGQPIVYPMGGSPGQDVPMGVTAIIHCPVTCTEGDINTYVSYKIKIAESSWLSTPGTELIVLQGSMPISPGQTEDAVGGWAASGAVGSKDISVEVYYNGNLIQSNHFDDAFHVVAAGGSGNISFSVSVWGIPGNFPSYTQWSCYYYDPVLGSFVGDQRDHPSTERITFNNISAGGYLAVFLRNGSSVSGQYSSPEWTINPGGEYTFDVQMLAVYG